MLKFKNGRFYPTVTPARLSFSIPDGFLLDTDPDVVGEFSFIIWTPGEEAEINLCLSSLIKGEDIYSNLADTYEDEHEDEPEIKPFTCHGFDGQYCVMSQNTGDSVSALLDVGTLEMVGLNGDYGVLEVIITVYKPSTMKEMIEKYHLDTLLDRILVIE